MAEQGLGQHYNDVIIGTMASQTTGVTIVYSTICFQVQIKKRSELRVTGLCEGNSPVTGEFPAQRVSKSENIPIWWRHHEWEKTLFHVSPLATTMLIHM